MPKGKYRGISLEKKLIEKIEAFIQSNPDKAYRSIADFATDAIRHHLIELGGLKPALSLMHINIEDSTVLLWDVDLRKSVEVTFNHANVSCRTCESKNCRHIKFALELPEVKAKIKRRRKLGLPTPENDE